MLGAAAVATRRTEDNGGARVVQALPSAVGGLAPAAGPAQKGGAAAKSIWSGNGSQEMAGAYWMVFQGYVATSPREPFASLVPEGVTHPLW